MGRITNPGHPNADQVGTDVQYKGEPHRITNVGGNYFQLVRHSDGWGQNVRVDEVNKH